MRLLSLFSPTRSFLPGSCALLLLATPAVAQYDAWRGYFSIGAGPALPRFAYRRDVSVSLQLPRRTLPTVALGATRQLMEHFAVGAEQRLTGLDYTLRYRHYNGNTSTVQLAEGILLQNGVNAQLLLPLGLDWELGLVTNASFALASLGVYDGPAYVWRPGSSGDGQELKMSISQIRQTTLFTGAELRLLHWLGGSPHGLQLTAGYQQGLYNLVRADSQNFEYNGADSQLYRGAFGLRLKGSYTSVQVGYCYAFGQAQAAAPKRRWSSPRYSQPAPPPADEDEPLEAEPEE